MVSLMKCTSATPSTEGLTICEEDVLAAQAAWADGILTIGRIYSDKGDYQARAAQHVNELYGYGHGKVLFKPTFASAQQFRPNFDDAMSYFVRGHIEEDNGFAIRPWSNVRFGEQEISILGDVAIAMGNYYVTPMDGGEETKVEFSFCYARDEDGKLRIYLHHSSLPFKGM